MDLASEVLIVDVRVDAEFDAGHVPNSVSNPIVTRRFGAVLSWLASRGERLVIVGGDEPQVRGAATVANALGIEVFGQLEGGIGRWSAESRPLGLIRRLTVPELHREWSETPRVQVLDVREPKEVSTGKIPGSTSVPYQEIDAVPDGLAADEPIAVICANGVRSSVAASWLKRLGAADPIHVVGGGVGQWSAAGWPVD